MLYVINNSFTEVTVASGWQFIYSRHIWKIQNFLLSPRAILDTLKISTYQILLGFVAVSLHVTFTHAH